MHDVVIVSAWHRVDCLRKCRMLAENWKIVMPYVQRCYHIGLQSSNIGSKPEPRAAVDVLPNPIPDYGRQTVVLKQ